MPDEWIFENVLWTMAHTKLVAEGAAATVAALRGGQVEAPPGTNVVCVLSGGKPRPRAAPRAALELGPTPRRVTRLRT